MKKVYCSSCGKQFETEGRGHICPECKEAAKKAAVAKAAEKRKELKAQGLASIPVNLSVHFRDTIKKLAAEAGITMPDMADKVLAVYLDSIEG